MYTSYYSIIQALCIGLGLFSTCYGQYAPGPGQPGSSAIPSNDASISAWGQQVTIDRGWQDIADTTLGKASFGSPSDALGPSDPAVVSLGDGGSATYSFSNPLVNSPGFDFAVFENGFSDAFLELAFVEVSTDDSTYIRFPAHSLTDTSSQVGGFSLWGDPTKLHNLAGKYRATFGTPFDLEELRGQIDVNQIRYVRIVDVVGSVDPRYASYDTAGRAINDPYPTAFSSGGFDLDALALLNQNATSIIPVRGSGSPQVYPNPASVKSPIFIEGNPDEVEVFDALGKKVGIEPSSIKEFQISEPGVYTVFMLKGYQRITQKLVVR